MANQTPTRRPKFVTQLDGSALQWSNCRMASISMGLDYHTAGDDTATASKMRTYTDDQSGGTDSGDARQAWDRGYDQSLDVEDGKTFADALASLRAGSLVHLDVWHAAMADGCVSGTGEYGHTIAVLADFDGEWAVGDPLCSGYKRVPESRLKSGAEEWGRRVYGAAALEADWATAGPDLRMAIVQRIVKRLMDRSHPGNVQPIDDYPDTGGVQPILFTRTRAQPLEGDDMELYSAGSELRRYPAGTDLYDAPGGAKVGDLSEAQANSNVFRIVATNKEGTWGLIDGGGAGKLMRWVKL